MRVAVIRKAGSADGSAASAAAARLASLARPRPRRGAGLSGRWGVSGRAAGSARVS